MADLKPERSRDSFHPGLLISIDGTDCGRSILDGGKVGW
jgi:hypothetical protein